ncbi:MULTISPECIES: SPOR domain-containing protein [unclassified Pseudomonas]|uniref:SPOR domain-containing protein n=1 Tax=unclassified Pseudomonas TaxID=196821 RepID=UPI002B22630D|nr:MULTISPECIES: SPOR domain-containing protein [unclassified Pseudomonas]MEB0007500.1 SPOR domain-containing protein [Pseudomonas sp. RTB2]MEB0018996.1 SPOR domain-containing protein [Pseudomonas sp. RTB3]MEB0148992.1 SPOR domain-containing protein [Pseudomonas sp. CCC2.2]MEB0270850.1 SPOR domain-containing protein [Pseudomonas sp. 5B4]MEE3509051.1 SPOR domain-containing protein [Pseudomonas sp. 10C3]
MALLDNVFKQRMVGALVLVALAVIFLPMLFSRQDETRRVSVDVPATPQTPATPQVQVDPVAVPEPQSLPQEPVPTDEDLAQPKASSVPVPITTVTPSVATTQPVPAVKPAAAQAPAKPAADPSRVDANGLSVSWSVQLASLSNRASADTLQKSLRAQGYNAYIRSSDGLNRVFVGPLIERAEADRLRDQLSKQQKLNGLVVRFQPERN